MPNPIRIYSDNRGAVLFEGRRAIEPKFVGNSGSIRIFRGPYTDSTYGSFQS